MRIAISIDTNNDSYDEVRDVIDAVFSVQGVDTNQIEHVVVDTGAVAGVGQLDNTGLPWDARIHLSPAKLTSKGAWSSRRGLDKQLVASVEAELRAAASSATLPPAANGAVVPPVAPPAPPAAPAMPPMLVPPAAPPVPPPAATAYEKIIKLIGDNLYSATNPNGRISDEWVQKSLEAFSVPGGLLANVATMDPAQVERIYAGLHATLSQ